MRVFGIDPGSNRTGYGCVDTDGRRHRLVLCGAIRAGDSGDFPDRLATIYRELSAVIGECRPDCVAIENLFHATNVRSALKLGHARGVAMLAAVRGRRARRRIHPCRDQARGCRLWTRGEAAGPADDQAAARARSRAEPHDAADALAVAICHLHRRVVLPNGGRPNERTSRRSDRRSPVRSSRPRVPGATTSLHDRVPSRARARKTSQPGDRRCRRRGLRRGGAALDVLRCRRRWR